MRWPIGQERYFHLLDAYWLSAGGELPVTYPQRYTWELIGGLRSKRRPYAPLLVTFARAANRRESPAPTRNLLRQARLLATAEWIARNANRAFLERLILDELNHGTEDSGARFVSQTLFGVPVERLNLLEISTLAALATQGPFAACDEHPRGYGHALEIHRRLKDRSIECVDSTFDGQTSTNFP
ncbi:MAG: hypothetical protein AAFQ82_24555 [Myxococcota bacterium]